MPFRKEYFLELLKAGKGMDANQYLKAEGPNVTALNLMNSGINDEAKVKALMEGVRGSNVILLHLGSNDIKGAAAVKALGEGLRGTNVTSLNLRNNSINDAAAAKALVKGLRGTKIASLNLMLNGINDAATVKALGEGLRGTMVTSLNLIHNDINDVATAKALGEGLRGTNVASLDLMNSGINDGATMKALMEGLRGTNVTSLNLTNSGNHYVDTVKALVQGLPDTKVTSLIFRSARVTDEGAQLLATNSTLTSLDVGDNKIGAIGAKALAANKTLTFLKIENNPCVEVPISKREMDKPAIAVGRVRKLVALIERNTTQGFMKPITDTEKLLDDRIKTQNTDLTNTIFKTAPAPRLSNEVRDDIKASLDRALTDRCLRLKASNPAFEEALFNSACRKTVIKELQESIQSYFGAKSVAKMEPADIDKLTNEIAVSLADKIAPQQRQFKGPAANSKVR